MTEILVFPRESIFRLPEAGTRPFHETGWPAGWSWGERARMEEDENWLQLIPYLILVEGKESLWVYRRCGGDRRLDGSFSCGVGGHVEREDEKATLEETARAALLRETSEELAVDLSGVSMEPVAWLYEGRSPVGRVHLGLIYIVRWLMEEPPIPVEGEALEGQGFMLADGIAEDRRFELWSRLAAGFVSGMQ